MSRKQKKQKVNWTTLVDDIVMFRKILHTITPYDIIHGQVNDDREHISSNLMIFLTLIYQEERFSRIKDSCNLFWLLMLYREGIQFLFIPNYSNDRFRFNLMVFLSKIVVAQRSLTQKQLN